MVLMAVVAVLAGAFGAGVVGYIGYRVVEHKLTPAAPEPPRVDTATKAFHDAFGRAYNDEADRIDNGTATDWAATKDALAKAGSVQKAAFSSALDAAQRAHTDDKGGFLDRKGAAAVLRGVAKAWK
jgi:hypothetical protein